jgi:hypothetical protein
MEIDSLTFLFNAYKSFLKISSPKYIPYEKFMLRKSIFSSYDFLSLKLEDRFLLLRNNLTDDKIKTFLVFLYNLECDYMRIDNLKISWKDSCSNKNVIFENILRCYPIDSPVNIFRRVLEDVHIDFMIGFEKYFFNLKDEFLLFLLKYRKFTFEECLEYYNKSKIIINKTGDKLFEHKLTDIIKDVYHRINKKSLSMRLTLKLFSHDLILCDDIEYDALFHDEKIFFKVNREMGKAIVETILFHEAVHTICRYEERFDDFLDAYKNEYTKNDITRVWSRAKETCINQILGFYANNVLFENLITKDNFHTLSIVTTSLLALKQLKRHKEGLLWK